MKKLLFVLFCIFPIVGYCENLPELDLSLSDSDNYIILEAKLAKFKISEGFQAFQIDDKYFIPLSEITEGFEFPITVDAFEGTANGWYMDESRTFKLDLKKGIAESNSHEISLTKDNVLWGEDDIYVESTLLNKLFPLEANVDPLDLVLKMESLEPMPFEEKILREKKQKMINKNKAEKLEFSKPFIENNSFFTFPFLDFGINFQHEKDSEKEAQNISYSIAGNGILFGLDSSFNYFNSIQSNIQYARFQVSRFTPINGIGGMKYFEAGDVNSYNMKLISSAGTGRGFSFSTFNEKGNSVDRELNLTGMLSEGWEVELYQNNILKDFSKGNGAGQYDFDDIDLSLGTNKIKLVFYGEQGEIREEERNIFLAPTSVNKGDFDFRFFAQETNMPTIDLSESHSAGYKTGGYLEYGLAENTSITTGLVGYIPPEISEEGEDDEEEDDEEETTSGYDEVRGMLGLKTGFSVFQLGLNMAYTENSESPAFEGMIEGNFGIYNLYFEHGIFNEMQTEKSYLDGSFLETKSKVSLRGRISIPYIGAFPFLSRYTVATNLENQKYSELNNTLSFSLWRLYLSLENIHKIKFDDYEENNAVSSLNVRMGDFSVRGTSRYDVLNHYLKSTSLGVDFRLKKTIFFQTSWSRTMSEIDDEIQDTYSISVSKEFSFGSLSLSGSTASSGSSAIKLSYNASMLTSIEKNRVVIDKTGLSQKGVFHSRTYLDVDYDGVYSENDEIIPDILYKSVGVQSRETGNKINTCLRGAKPYELTTVQIDERSIEDMTYHPVERFKVILPRRGVITNVEFALIQQGEIDGELREKKEDISQPLSGIKMVIYKDGKIVADTITDQDGYYTFTHLNPGEYTIKVDEEQATSLDYILSEPVIFTMDKEELFLSIDTIYIEKLLVEKEEVEEEEIIDEN